MVNDSVHPDQDTSDDTRRPRSVYGVGQEPDPQVSMSNERTALSWVRTALALVAGGIALATLVSFGELPTLLLVIASIVSLGGGLLGAWALWHWSKTERALRRDDKLPAPSALPWLVFGTVAVSIMLATFAAFEAIERSG